MDAESGTPEGAELTYLAGIAASVEEYGEENCAGSALAPFPSPPTPTVEEVARKLCDHEWNGTQPWDRKPETFRERYREEARAVLALFTTQQDQTP